MIGPVLALLLAGSACRRGSEGTQALPSDAGWAEQVSSPFPCVHFTQLQRFLPASLAGFRLVRDHASTGKYEDVSVSEAERLFTQDDREVSVRIVDTTLGGKLAEAIRAASEQPASGSSSEEGGPLKLDGALGFVRYELSERKAEANLLVGSRFIVSVTSRGVQGTAEVRRIARGLDLVGLSSLRDPTWRE